MRNALTTLLLVLATHAASHWRRVAAPRGDRQTAARVAGGFGFDSRGGHQNHPKQKEPTMSRDKQNQIRAYRRKLRREPEAARLDRALRKQHHALRRYRNELRAVR
jgi:Spy/CpxP family protein refolding chaperone